MSKFLQDADNVNDDDNDDAKAIRWVSATLS